MVAGSSKVVKTIRTVDTWLTEMCDINCIVNYGPPLALSRLYAMPMWWVVQKSVHRDIIEYEAKRWAECIGDVELIEASSFDRFVRLFARRIEFRTLVHYRLRSLPLPIRLLCRRIWPGLDSLYLATENIDPGLFIQHGFSTGIDAVRVGKDCWINQQVTVGNSPNGKPTIGDRVMIGAGAMLIGPITIGDDSVIGANATVVTDVPAGAVFVGPKATEIRRSEYGPAH